METITDLNFFDPLEFLGTYCGCLNWHTGLQKCSGYGPGSRKKLLTEKQTTYGAILYGCFS